MSETKSSTERLRDIWAAWGLSPPQAEATAQRDALAALQTYLASGPTALVRCMQALLVDPESPGAHKRALFQPLWTATHEKWAAAGTGKDDVRLLQAMLLAVTWPEEQEGKGLAPALLSPWMAEFKERTREHAVWLIQRANEKYDKTVLGSAGPTLEYLWWGQARYCHTLRTPFRRIRDRRSSTWLAAIEATERAVGLPVEPSASYLQEVLHAIGNTCSDTQPVKTHFEQLRDLLASAERPRVPDSLAELVTQDALGLPIVRLCVPHTISNDDLMSTIAIPPDAALDYGSWAAWIFRELVLIRRWPEPPK